MTIPTDAQKGEILSGFYFNNFTDLLSQDNKKTKKIKTNEMMPFSPEQEKDGYRAYACNCWDCRRARITLYQNTTQNEENIAEKENKNMYIKVIIMSTVKVAPGTVAGEEEVLSDKGVAAKDANTAILLTGAENAEAINKMKNTHTFRVVTSTPQ